MKSISLAIRSRKHQACHTVVYGAKILLEADMLLLVVFTLAALAAVPTHAITGVAYRCNLLSPAGSWKQSNAAAPLSCYYKYSSGLG